MNMLKHILIVIALMVAAVPCCHAAAHDAHGHEHEAEAQLCAAHHCMCHACDEIPCSNELEMPQEQTIASGPIVASVSSIQLFAFSETKPAARQGPPAATGILASIQTVQLLI